MPGFQWFLATAHFEINISDDGKGFDASALDIKTRIAGTVLGDGLINMRRRLADIGGHCQIESAPGKGQTSGS